MKVGNGSQQRLPPTEHGHKGGYAGTFDIVLEQTHIQN
jgi:hypothetical protein